MRKTVTSLPFKCMSVKFLYFYIFAPENTRFFKNPKNYFKLFILFFNTCHQGKFEKNLTSIFKRTSNTLILGPKMARFPYFETGLNCSEKSKSITFTNSQMPKIMYNFTNILKTDLEKVQKC